VICALAILSALRLQANAIIRHRNRDSAIIGGQRHSHRQPPMQVSAAPMSSRVAQRLLHGAQQQIGHNRGQGIGGDTRLTGSVEGQRVEVATELAIEGGAQGAHQPMFEMALVRYRRGAHQSRQVMMRLA
jgi:hypothetical protein